MIARSSPSRSSRPEPSRKVSSCSPCAHHAHSPTEVGRPRESERRTARSPKRSVSERSDLGIARVREPDPWQARARVERQGRDHAGAGRHEPRLRAPPGDRYRMLRAERHAKRVREVAVVAEARHVVKRVESPLDLRSVQGHQALPLERPKRGPNVRGDGRRSTLRRRRVERRTSVSPRASEIEARGAERRSQSRR